MLFVWAAILTYGFLISSSPIGLLHMAVPRSTKPRPRRSDRPWIGSEVDQNRRLVDRTMHLRQEKQIVNNCRLGEAKEKPWVKKHVVFVAEVLWFVLVVWKFCGL